MIFLNCQSFLIKKIEVQANIKFLVKLNKIATEMFNLLCEVYGENTLSRAHMFEWYKRFSEGREGMEDDKKTWPSGNKEN